jgi:hypothetical protein
MLPVNEHANFGTYQNFRSLMWCPFKQIPGSRYPHPGLCGIVRQSLQRRLYDLIKSSVAPLIAPIVSTQGERIDIYDTEANYLLRDYMGILKARRIFGAHPAKLASTVAAKSSHRVPLSHRSVHWLVIAIPKNST